MTPGVMITLIICMTILLIIGAMLIAAVAINRQKKQETKQGPSVYHYDGQGRRK